MRNADLPGYRESGLSNRFVVASTAGDAHSEKWSLAMATVATARDPSVAPPSVRPAILIECDRTGACKVVCPRCAADHDPDGWIRCAGPLVISQPPRVAYKSEADYRRAVKRRFSCHECGVPLRDVSGRDATNQLMGRFSRARTPAHRPR